jgi:DNA adenine methylase
VPYGKYKRPYFPEREIKFLPKRRAGQRLFASYVHTLEMVVEGDVVYCDPPYLTVKTSLTTKWF